VIRNPEFASHSGWTLIHAQLEQIWSTASGAAKWGHGLLQPHGAARAGSVPDHGGWQPILGAGPCGALGGRQIVKGS
jgi:hypothetical protein